MKKTILWILLDLVVLAVFNSLFFVIGGTGHEKSVWISYGFIHFAYAMLLITPLLIRNSSSSSVFGYSLYSISSVYFIVEFVIGLVFIIVNPYTIKAALIIQVIIAGIYAVILLSHLIANEDTADKVEKHENEVAFIKQASIQIKALVGKSDSKKANKEIEKAFDLLHSSPSKSNNAVAPLESAILRTVAELEGTVSSKDEDEIISKAREIISLAEARNSELKKSN